MHASTPCDLAELFPEGGGLLTYIARPCYLLLEARFLPSSKLPGRNRVSLMVRMEAADGKAELLEALRSGDEWLRGEDAALWRDYLTWFTEVLVPLRFPDMDLERMRTLKEDLDMIEETLVEERRREERKWRDRVKQGVEQGVKQGVERQRTLLRRQAALKFGEPAAARLEVYLARIFHQ